MIVVEDGCGFMTSKVWRLLIDMEWLEAAIHDFMT